MPSGHENALRVERGTKQAAYYFARTDTTMQLFGLIADTVMSINYFQEGLKRALAGPEPEGEKLTPGKLAASNPGPRTQALRRAGQPLLELLVGRAVDNFQTYVVSIIREVLRKRPEIFGGSEYKLDVKSILEHRTIDSLIGDLVERKVDDLSYRGFEDLAEWCQQHGIPLIVAAADLEQVIELIATRNAIAHNGGVVDQKYFSTVKTSRFKVGDVRTLAADEVTSAIALLNRIVDSTDRLAISSFGLAAVEIKFPGA
jgi:hypothetical protein